MEGSKRTVVAFYDSERCPLTYDFCHFAAMARGFAGDRPLHFVFLPKKDGTWSKPGKFDWAEQEFRKTHLVYPLVSLFGATYTICQSREHAKLYESRGEAFPVGYSVDRPIFSYMLDSLIEFYGAGVPVTPPKPSDSAVGHIKTWLSQFKKPVVCVTLRTSRYPTRNSDVSSWIEYSGARNDLDWVFLPDTGVACHPAWGKWQTFLPACYDQDLRLALYHSVKFNCFTSNGCGSLLWFGDKPYAFFKAGGEGYITKEQWADLGIPYASQPPWVRFNQRWIWKPDDRNVIAETFKDMGI